MRFLIDECLHESLVAVAHKAGFDASHVNHLGLTGPPDSALAERIDLHPGLIVIVPNVVPALQRSLFQAAILYLAGKDLVNTVIEVSLAGDTVQVVEYELPRG